MTKQTGFVDRESYKHSVAKELLADWCREAEEKAKYTAKVAQFEWRPNQGVHTEVQFCEKDSSYYLENRYPGDTIRDESMYRSNDFGKILFVPDILIFVKGEIRIIFEVKHTSGVSLEKKFKIRSRLPNCQVFEISADEILRHDKRIVPDFLKCTQLL